MKQMSEVEEKKPFTSSVNISHASPYLHPVSQLILGYIIWTAIVDP